MTGDGPRIAARQCAALFALAGSLALVSLPLQPDRAAILLLIGLADLTVGLFAWWLPWPRYPAWAPLLLSVPAFGILAVSTVAFGGMATGTGPFLVLVYAWVGLNFPLWAVFAVAPLALAAYVVPLVITRQPAFIVSSAVVLLPVAVAVAALIAVEVRHLRAARERIAQVERWRAALAATLARDLRAPLTGVQLVLEAVRDGEDLDPVERRQMIDVALRQSSRILRLAAGLLDLERVDARGTLRLDRAVVPVRAAVLDAVAQLNTTEVKIEVVPDLTVEADPERLEQILVNLIGNALQHGVPPVVVRGYAESGVARIEVRDHGPGVPEEAVPHLFTRFGDAGTAGSPVGLGLWIVHQFARAHGGSVRYEPANPGARLIVELPLRRIRPAV
jgi:signal transduction histidine kinase